MFLLIAHGESWEEAASRAVTDMVQKVLAEHDNSKENLQENGTFELHYTPANTANKTFSISLSSPLDLKAIKNANTNGDELTRTRH